MSGHSKWHQIKHKKGAADAKKGAIFTRHAKLITLAAKQGGDAEMNPTLRMAIEKARMDNMPNANIERAVKKGTGELKEGANFSEGFYDAYGPAGTAFYIHYLTDNKNRTSSSIKTILNKFGGRLGEAGSVAWMFEKKGVILIKAPKERHEEIELAAIDAGAADIEGEGESVEVHTGPAHLFAIKEKLQAGGYEITSSELTFVPKSSSRVEDADEAKKIMNLAETLEEDEDVVAVYSNFDIPEALL